MALALTSLNGAITKNARQIRLTAFTNPQVGPIGPDVMLLVDGEWMRMASALLSPVLDVTRGDSNGVAGATATAHGTLAPVIYGLSSDFTSGTNVSVAPTYTYGADATITNPIVDATIYITKATAAALTLTDPNVDNQSTVRIVSLTAAAHLITYATGFYDNTTTSDVATYPATAGATLTLVAQGGKWRPVATADDGVTIA